MAKIGVVADDFTGTASSGMMMAKAQVELLEKSEISVEHISVSPKSLLKGGEEARSEVKRVVEKARKIFDLDHTPEAVLIETALHDSVVNLKEEDEKQNLPFGSCSDRINAGLAEITNEILEKYARDKISGMMVIPLLLGSLLITIFPNIFDIGGLTAAVFSSAATNTLLGAQLFCMGTALKVRDMPKVLKRGGVLLLAKFVIGAILGIIVGKVFGTNGFLGLSSLAIICAVTNSNGSVYLTLMGEYGDEADCGCFPLLALNDGLFFTLVALGVSGLANIPIQSLVAAIIPIALGMLLGNLDEGLKNLFAPMGSAIIPLIGFALGTGINLANVVKGAYAALLSDAYSAERARLSNDANIACMGAFTTGSKERELMTQIFLTNEFVAGCSSQPKVDAFRKYDMEEK